MTPLSVRPQLEVTTRDLRVGEQHPGAVAPDLDGLRDEDVDVGPSRFADDDSARHGHSAAGYWGQVAW